MSNRTVLAEYQRDRLHRENVAHQWRLVTMKRAMTAGDVLRTMAR